MCEGVEWHLLLSCDPTSPDLNFAMFADVTPIVDLPTLVVVQKPEFPMFAPVLQSSQCSCAPLITWKIGGVSEVRRGQASKGNDISGCTHQMS